MELFLFKRKEKHAFAPDSSKSWACMEPNPHPCTGLRLVPPSEEMHLFIIKQGDPNLYLTGLHVFLLET